MAMVKKPTEDKKIIQHLFRKDRRIEKEKEGWKFVKEQADLVLMEK